MAALRFWSVFAWLILLALLAHYSLYSLPVPYPDSPWWVSANVALAVITASALASLLEIREGGRCD